MTVLCDNCDSHVDEMDLIRFYSGYNACKTCVRDEDLQECRDCRVVYARIDMTAVDYINTAGDVVAWGPMCEACSCSHDHSAACPRCEADDDYDIEDPRYWNPQPCICGAAHQQPATCS